VVSTPLKNISQLELLFPIYGKIQIVPNHQPALIYAIENGVFFTSQNGNRLGVGCGSGKFPASFRLVGDIGDDLTGDLTINHGGLTLLPWVGL